MNSQLYESFNARNYTPAQVAETFIASDDYYDLWRNEHTVVLGPRGSGKTTLFKMLTVQALYSWSHAQAKQFRSKRPFTAIYVPTDMHWHHQLKHAEQQLIDAPRFSIAASRAAVTTSILLAAARTFQDRLLNEAFGEDDKETEFCLLLADKWQLARILPRLEVVILALKSRIAEIRRIVNHAIFENASDDHIKAVPEYFHQDYFAELDTACTAFDMIFRLPQSPKWAICLDELELAPTWLQTLAFSQQRSAEEKFLIKLSTSPLPNALGITESRPKQDLRLICIWNHANRHDKDFAETLSRSVLRRRLGAEVTPEAVFGRSDLVLQSEETVGKYERGSAEWHLFRDVSAWDVSLRQLFVDAKIDPNDPVTDDVRLRDSLFRKAKPVAMLRRAFLKSSGAGGFSLRSRKLGTIYYGREAIYRVSDGNPRRLIGILGDLCPRLTKNKEGVFQRLGVNEQAEVLTRASLHFSGYVHALPGGNTPIAGHSIDLAELLRVIGDYFRRQLLGPHFQLDPAGSFQIDSHINNSIVELLRLGVYHGAVVYVDPVPDTIVSNLRGKRFRLSYMLSPLYKLPLNLHEPISLSNILQSSSRLRIKRVLPAMIAQKELELRPPD